MPIGRSRITISITRSCSTVFAVPEVGGRQRSAIASPLTSGFGLRLGCADGLRRGASGEPGSRTVEFQGRTPGLCGRCVRERVVQGADVLDELNELDEWTLPSTVMADGCGSGLPAVSQSARRAPVAVAPEPGRCAPVLGGAEGDGLRQGETSRPCGLGEFTRAERGGDPLWS